MGMVRGVIIPSGMAAHENQKNKQEVHFLPPPYTVVQTLASRLRKIHEKQETPITLVPSIQITIQGRLAVIFDMNDYVNFLTYDCKYTLVGKFTSVMPKMELIRKCFISQTQLSVGVNIAHYNH